MMMTEPFGGTLLDQVLLHAGYVIAACAFLVRPILWLRLLAIVANLCVGMVAFRMTPDPAWAAFSWNMAFVAINAGHSAWLIYERNLLRFTAEEKTLVETAFEALDPVLVRRLLRRGEWVDLSDKTTLVRQGIIQEKVHLIVSGVAAVLLGGRIVTRLSTGKFVGEVSYLTGEPASATVVATEAMRCIVWDKSVLESLLQRRPEIRSVVYAAIGNDLAGKIASHNVRLSQL